MKFNGEGIQHIALLSDNLIDTIDQLGLAGVPLMTAPNDVYYEMLETRLPGHGEPVGELQARGILLDGTTEGGTPRLLLQIFSETAFGGPVFFEFIQRKGDYSEGFGEGNFRRCSSRSSATRCAAACYRRAEDGSAAAPAGEQLGHPLPRAQHEACALHVGLRDQRCFADRLAVRLAQPPCRSPRPWPPGPPGPA